MVRKNVGQTKYLPHNIQSLPLSKKRLMLPYSTKAHVAKDSVLLSQYLHW